MKLVGEQTTLVIAGAWNPNILNPNWIGREILGKPAGEASQVNMLLPIQGIGGPLRLSFEGLSISAAPETLTFHLDPADAPAVAKAFSVAADILDTLPHTPVTAMGLNFNYVAEPGDIAQTQSFGWSTAIADLVPVADVEVVNKRWQLALQLNDHLLNLGCSETAAAIQVEANHHFELEGKAKRAAEILRTEHLYVSLRRMTDEIVSGIYKEGPHES